MLLVCLAISGLGVTLSAAWKMEQGAYPSAQLTTSGAASFECSPQRMERDTESPGVFRYSHDGLSTAVSSVRGSVSATPNVEGSSVFHYGASVSPSFYHSAASSTSPSTIGHYLPLPTAAFTSLRGIEQGTSGSDLVPKCRSSTAVPSEFVSSVYDEQGLQPRFLVPMTPQQYKAWRSGLLSAEVEKLQSDLYGIVRDILWDRFTAVEDIFYADHPDGGRYCDPPYILSFFRKWNSEPTNSFQLNYSPHVFDIEFYVSRLIAVKEEMGDLGIVLHWKAPDRHMFLPQEIA